MIYKALILIFGIVMATVTVGCNTVKGVGEDVQGGGEAISSSAQAVSNKL